MGVGVRGFFPLIELDEKQHPRGQGQMARSIKVTNLQLSVNGLSID